MPGDDVGVVLHLSNQHLIASLHLRLAERGGYQIDGFCSATRKDNLLYLTGIDKAAHLLTGGFVQVGSLLTEVVYAAMHVGVDVEVLVAHSIEHAQRLLCGGSIVQIYQWLTVYLTTQYWEIFSYFLYVKHVFFLKCATKVRKNMHYALFIMNYFVSLHADKTFKHILRMKQFVLTLMMATAVCTTAFAQNKVKNVYASSPKLNMEMLQNTDQTVQLNRYFFAGYNTLCLPMTVAADQLGDVTIERFHGMQQEGDVLKLYFVECTNEGIQAGVPYLVNSPKSQYLRIKNTDAIMFDSEVQPVRMSDNNGNVVTFGSAWETVEKAGRYGIPAQQNVTPLEAVLIKTTPEQKFLPTRCGFTWDQQSASAKELRIIHISQSEATNINNVRFQNISEDAYDLNGRKVNNSTKGLRIQNGKKTIVK